MAVRDTETKKRSVKGDLLKAIKLVVEIRKIDTIKNNDYWDGKLGALGNEIERSLGSILVKEEIEKEK